MGLFIGMSAITICEFIDIFVYNVLNLCCKKKRIVSPC